MDELVKSGKVRNIATSNYAGKKATFKLAPIVVGWDTAPPPIALDTARMAWVTERTRTGISG